MAKLATGVGDRLEIHFSSGPTTATSISLSIIMFLVVVVERSCFAATPTQQLAFSQRKLSRAKPEINRIIPAKGMKYARCTGFGVKFGQHPVSNPLAGENRK
jgi:hypothetical protein